MNFPPGLLGIPIRRCWHQHSRTFAERLVCIWAGDRRDAPAPRPTHAIGDRAVGGDAVRDGKGQDHLCQIEVSLSEKHVSLVYQVENGPHDQRHNKRPPWHAIRNGVEPDLPVAVDGART